MSPRIFISYRREDSAGYAGRLYDRLAGNFGEGNVFMDVDALDPGVDFVDVVDRSVRACDALVAVIGRSWLAVDPQSGGRRIDDPGDFVRLEIEAALARGVLVVPALVQNAPMPGPGDLPDSIAALARRNGIWLSHERWDYDVGRLISAIEESVRRAAEPASTQEQVEQPQPDLAVSKPAGRSRRAMIAGAAGAAITAAAIAGVLLTRDGDGSRATPPGPTQTSGAVADLAVEFEKTRVNATTVDFRVIAHNAGPDDAVSATLRAVLSGPSFTISNLRTQGDGTCALEKSSAPNEILCSFRSIPGTGEGVAVFRVTVRGGGTLDIVAEASSKTFDDSLDDNHGDSGDEYFESP